MNYLPHEVVAALDVSAPELIKETFIDTDLQAHFADLLYRVELVGGGEAYAYFLFEHKSWSDEFTPFQLLRYKVRIWEQKLREKSKRLPLIIPIVIHHGRSLWQANTKFEALVENAEHPALGKYVPHFEHHLCDLSAYDETQIKGAAVLRVTLSVLKHIFSDDLSNRLAEIFSLLKQMPEQSALEFLQTVMKYLSVATDRVTADDLTESLTTAFPEKEGGLMSTLAEQWIQQGVQEGLLRSTLKLLRRRLGDLSEQIQKKISSLPIDRLDQLGDKLFDFRTADDLDAWLRAIEEEQNQSGTQTQ